MTPDPPRPPDRPRDRPRARDLGLPLGGTPGSLNALTDVPGVGVGVCTVLADGPPRVRTGVTAIVPRVLDRDLVPVWAGFHALNGNGEMTGTHWVAEAGRFAGPVLLTNTHSVGVAHHAAVRWMVDRHRRAFEASHLWAMPVVAETYDGVLSDVNGLHVTEAHARAALDAAVGPTGTGPVPEGGVGGGAGAIAYGFRGGTGTSSRLVAVRGGGAEVQGTVAALVQANHGVRPWLTVCGVPVGRRLTAAWPATPETGSIVVILATDLPLSPIQLQRLARRATLGVGRGGTVGGNGSGDLFLAFTTANPPPAPGTPDRPAPLTVGLTVLNDDFLDPVFAAAVEATEEAVLNAMLAAADAPTVRPPGRIVPALRADALLEAMRGHGRELTRLREVQS